METSPETEPNSTCATANGPYTIKAGAIGTLITGAFSPSGDQDWYAFTVPNYADLSFETFDSTALGSCAPTSVDTVIQLYKSDCATAFSTSQDQGGVGNCSKLYPTSQAVMGHVPPGTYYLKVYDFNGTGTYSYQIQAKYIALCGDGVKAGTEECDGSATCGTDCRILPVCGDSVKQTAEQCDDGNAVAGDGCSATCQWETIAEVEPNNTTANADTNATNNPQFLINSNRNITGAMTGTTDKDIFKVVIAANNTVIRAETFDSSGLDCRTAAPYSMSAHNLRILNSAGTTIVSDTASSGIGTCASLAYRLDAGTYYIQVDKTAALAAYFLRVWFPAGNGSEVEPNETYATATADAGRTTHIFGGHQVATDTDYFAITVVAGASIRVETIEGDTSETCESSGIDSTISFYGPTGTLITSDGDTGRGFCSQLDGTGSTSLNSGLHNLAAGTYYIAVTSYTTSATAGNQFNYRLVVDVSF